LPFHACHRARSFQLGRSPLPPSPGLTTLLATASPTWQQRPSQGCTRRLRRPSRANAQVVGPRLYILRHFLAFIYHKKEPEQGAPVVFFRSPIPSLAVESVPAGGHSLSRQQEIGAYRLPQFFFSMRPRQSGGSRPKSNLRFERSKKLILMVGNSNGLLLYPLLRELIPNSPIIFRISMHNQGVRP
jgi:hypothetical protein